MFVHICEVLARPWVGVRVCYLHLLFERSYLCLLSIQCQMCASPCQKKQGDPPPAPIAERLKKTDDPPLSPSTHLRRQSSYFWTSPSHHSNYAHMRVVSSVAEQNRKLSGKKREQSTLSTDESKRKTIWLQTLSAKIELQDQIS